MGRDGSKPKKVCIILIRKRTEKELRDQSKVLGNIQRKSEGKGSENFQKSSRRKFLRK